MKSYLIGYDLNKSGQDYQTLISEIKKLGNWWHCLDSTWIVKSDLTPEQIVNKLKSYIDSNDELLVVNLNRDAAWIGFDKQCSDWLQSNI